MVASVVVGATATASAQSAVPESQYPGYCRQSLQQWSPYPGDADLMVVTAHPDDEGIFFGGTLPYYTKVAGKKTILVGMSGEESNHAGFNRREELERAAWHYGVRYKPINYQYVGTNSGTVDDVFNTWDPGGRDAVVGRLAADIRRYKIDVIVSHDPQGEYGHAEHKATSAAVLAAFDVAGDPSVSLGGLAPHQPQKLYLHKFNAPSIATNEIPSVKVTPEGYNFHSWESTHSQLSNKSSRQVTNEGLQCHQDAIKVWPDLQAVSRYAQGEVFEGHPGEDWGLIRSTVGPDTVPGQFFQNVVGNGGTAFPATRIDVGVPGMTPKAGWTALVGNPGQSVTVGPTTMTLFGFPTGNHRNRTRYLDVNGDFAFNERFDGAAVGLRLTGLPAGTYDVASWHNDVDGYRGRVQIEFGPTGGARSVLADNVRFSSGGVRYSITANGTSDYDLVFREDDANNRARFNGLTISKR